jgi:toxin-antitoxin system PIN domain toxin
VIAVDTNILVYAHRAESPFHTAALQAVTGLAEGDAPWGLPWPCVHEFLSTVTHPRILKPPTPLEVALDTIEQWLNSPSLLLLSEFEGYWRHLRSVATAGRVTGPRIHDARVAAICLQNGVHEFWSADRDFSRFPSLKVVNPVLR